MREREYRSVGEPSTLGTDVNPPRKSANEGVLDVVELDHRVTLLVVAAIGAVGSGSPGSTMSSYVLMLSLRSRGRDVGSQAGLHR